MPGEQARASGCGLVLSWLHDGADIFWIEGAVPEEVHSLPQDARMVHHEGVVRRYLEGGNPLEEHLLKANGSIVVSSQAPRPAT